MRTVLLPVFENVVRRFISSARWTPRTQWLAQREPQTARSRHAAQRG
jgi:hypothetical protein